MNPVGAYIDAHHDALGLERMGIERRPPCVVLTPRYHRSRHVIVLVLSGPRGEARLVGKLPRHAGDAQGLAREARNLRVLERVLAPADASSVPRLVAFQYRPPHPLLLETALAGMPLSPAALRRQRRAAVERLVIWLERLATATAARPRDVIWYERLVRAPLSELAERADAPTAAMVERTLERAEVLRDAGLPLVFEHGDLCHPNLLLTRDGAVGVLDWERAEPAGLPAQDLFFFLSYAAAGGRRRPTALREAFRGPRPWAWRVAELYARRLGIDRRLLAPLLAVSCARTVAGGNTAPRHLALWQLALEEAGP